jgi:hypothetical protein
MDGRPVLEYILSNRDDIFRSARSVMARNGPQRIIGAHSLFG